MAGEGRSLEETPTWAVAVVCFVMVTISVVIEYIIHLIGRWLKKKHKRALYESLEKVKSELMLLGFISLLLTVGQGPISEICVSESVGGSWHPCKKEKDEESTEGTSGSSSGGGGEHRRRLLNWSNMGGGSYRRVLVEESNKCADKGKVSFISQDGLHQLHIFIFVLAVFHVLYCILTMAFGRLKMRRWKHWEKETRTAEYQFSHDPERFRFARETSFGRRHLSFWSQSPILLWIVCFFRQFVRSVPKVDYLTLRHGFIMAHLAPHSQTGFNFQKYINRSLEEDFKVVVGISPPIWGFAVLFLLFNTHGWYSYLWLPFIPLIIILLVGTKLQMIITKMGLSIQERGEVVKGVPTVQLGDELFWFHRPRLVLYLINFVLFQNAFQLAFLVWTWYEFGVNSCFHEHTEDIVIRISMGVLIQILCSYVTLPLYALVTQMGSTMKPTIFNERVATALKSWHHTAKKQVKENKKSGQVTPVSSRPGTPSHGMSPIHLLRNHRPSDMESIQTSPTRSNFDSDWETDLDSPSPSYINRGGDEISATHHGSDVLDQLGNFNLDQNARDNEPSSTSQVGPVLRGATAEQRHEVVINVTKDFSFDKRTSSI